MSAEALWLILLMPVLSFLVIAFFTRPHHKLSGYLGIGAIFVTFLLALWALATALGFHEGDHLRTAFQWFELGTLKPEIALVLDPLTAVMLVVVTTVSLLVQIYSQGYMHGDPGYSRYYAFLSLFTFSMLGLVLADNLVLIYAFWEGVGLCSYLLIGHWFHKPEAAAAAKKAFIVTRLGDLGFLIGILVLYTNTGTFSFAELEELARVGTLGGTTLTIAALGLFSGAVGKSAQFPLHVWLPDAMEGPTPVSALIHAATMVAAGVYLVARAFPIFEHSAQAMNTVAIIGGFTALFAATMGIVMYDIKRVMAYSTISQLGYMMMGLGVGGLVAGIFHLFNHAFFKALLFLGSGSVIHGTGSQDMREMGGLRKYMPITFWTLLIASLSLAGIFPLSGFWSKDEILADTLESGNFILYLMGTLGAFITAFYVTRMMVMTFFGSYRGPQPAEHGGHGAHDAHGGHHGLPHESPWVMTLPLIILAVLSIFTGFWNLSGGFSEFLGEHHKEINLTVAGISTVAAVLGIVVGWVIYGARWVSAESLGRTFAPLHTLLSNKYYLDHLYLAIVNYIVLGISNLIWAIDRVVVDGIADGLGGITVGLGGGLRRIQNGQVQTYALVTFAGLLVIMAGFLVAGGR